MITKQQAALEAMEFLKKNTVGVLATAGADSKPFVSPVYYGVWEDFTIYFLTSHHTQKFKNILLNNQVAFCVGTGPSYTVVNIHGHAHMTEGEERQEAMQRVTSLVGSPLSEWPIRAMESSETGGLALFKITPTNVSYLNLTSQDQIDSMVKYAYEVLP